jgi:hypothetical protein
MPPERRTERRRRARRRHEDRHGTPPGSFPVIPGVIPNGDADTLDEAMREAHQVLPPIVGTKVVIASYGREDGLEMIAETWGPEVVARITAWLDDLGPDALVTFATRLPHNLADDIDDI